MGRGPKLRAFRDARARSGDLPIDRDPSRIEAMFGDIAPHYDLMNHLMTLGLDIRWRRMASCEASLAPEGSVLDACCGTGDLAFSLVESYPGCSVIGLDLTPTMVTRAREKAAARERRGLPVPKDFVVGDLLELPFPDASFAAVTVGWGVRNVPNVRRAFCEMTRVVRPGGRVVCLESTQPHEGVGRRFHDVWLGRVVPLLGRLVTGDRSAYSYLPASVATFPRAAELARIMADAGLVKVRYRRLGLGAVALHVGEVPT